MAAAHELRRDVVLIGTSGGGVQALSALFEKLPQGFSAAVGVVIHRSPTFVSSLASIFGRKSKLKVDEPHHGQLFERGCIYLAPRDHHMQIRQGALWLDRGPKQHHVRPAIDPMFTTGAQAYGPRVIGVLLTGSLSDGVAGLVDIKSHGGLSVVQDPEEAEYPGMPVNALLHDSVDLQFRIGSAAALLTALVHGDSIERVLALPGVSRPVPQDPDPWRRRTASGR